MTGEEMERAIEFILQRQATLEERIEQTQTQLAQTVESVSELNRTVQMQASSQSQFNETVTAAITALADSQQKLTDSQQKLVESQRQLADSLRHTDQKLDALIDIVRERLEGKDGGASS
jgi:chromosome segregation ATPase